MAQKNTTIAEMIEKLEYFKSFYGADAPVVKLFNDQGGVGMGEIDLALDMTATTDREGNVKIGFYVD